MSIRLHIQGLRLTDGIGQTDSAFLRQTRCHDVLGKVSSHICAAAIHLGAVLAGKGTTAVGHKAAIGVYHELSSGQTRVRFKAAQHKGTAGVNKHSCVLIQIFSQRRHKDELVDSFPQLLLAYLRLMLSGNYYGFDPHGLAILILHGHLGLAV